jgi:hypothetical protein
MIILSQSSFKAEGLTFFPDDRDEHAWYYLPGRPAISSAADGMAGVRLVKYRRLPTSEGPSGSGLLSLDVELGPTSDVLDRAIAALRAAHPGADLHIQPVSPDGVTCGIRVALGENAGPSAPPQSVSVDPPHRAGFQIVLSMAGTTLFETAMSGGAPIGTVEYQLRLTARRPSIPAVLTVDWNRAGELFANRPAADGPISFGQIEAGVRDLVASGSIRIDIRPPAAGDAMAAADPATHEAAMLVAASLFDAAAAGSAPAASGADGPSAIERAIMDAHSYVRRPAAISGSATYDLSQPRAAALTLSAADSLGHMMAAIPAGKMPPPTLMEERPGSFKIDVMALDIGKWIQLVEVTLTYGDRRVDLALDPDRPSGSATFVTDEQLGHRVGYQYRAFVRSAPFLEASQPSVEAPSRTTETGYLVIDPREVFNVIPLMAAAMFSFDQYRAAFVDVKVEVPGWSTTRTMMLEKGHSEDGFSIVIPRASTPAVQYRVRHVAQSGSVIEGRWQPTDGLTIVVGMPVPEPT